MGNLGRFFVYKKTT